MKNIYREIKWRNQERGHWRPLRILYKPEAEFRFRWFDVLVDKVRIAACKKEDKEFEKEWAKKKAEELKGIRKRNYGILKELVGWMDEGYAGERLAKRLNRTEIALVTYPDPEVDLWMSNMTAAYAVGTNAMKVIHFFDEEFGSEAYARERIAHELHHYAAYLEGGMRFRWRDDEGNPVFRKHARNAFEGVRVDWFQEALTEMLSLTLIESKGVAMTHKGYDTELLVALLAREIVGEKELRKAYFGGDFTEVRGIMNGKLGTGSFEKLVGSPGDRGSQFSAIELLEGMERAGIGIGGIPDRILVHFIGQYRSAYPGLIEMLEDRMERAGDLRMEKASLNRNSAKSYAKRKNVGGCLG